jgi:mono/diheme cytochrome c family protein
MHQGIKTLVRRLSVAGASLIIGSGAAHHAIAAPPDQPLGKTLYEAKCIQCHGREGKGNGPAAAYLSPRPRDFTAGKFKFRSTESGSIPTDDDLRTSVENGLHSTAMPGWKPFLRGDSLTAVLDYVKSFSPRFSNEKPHAVKPGPPVAASPASIAAGKKVFETLQCASCHGTDGEGKDAIAGPFQDDWGHDIQATRLTEPWTFRGGATPKDIYLRFRTGIDGSPMPSYVGSASDRDMWNLANYVASIGRKPVWAMNELELKNFFAHLDASAKERPAERGKYLVNTLGCGFCHSPVREDGSVIEEMWLAGGQRWNLYPFDDVVSYNLTSDKETGLGNWTDAQIKTFLTKGIRRNGSRMIPYPMPWPAFALLKEDDLNAIIAYLRTLPPVVNKIPDPKSPNIFSYMWGKFQALILKKDIPIHVYPGNAGATHGQSVSLNDGPAASARKEVRP